MLGAQAELLDHLVETVRSEQVDAVLVSGDVYDRALPSPDTVTLLSETVTRLVDAGAAVVISSGNHDSAIRLGFAADLLARSGLHIRSSLEGVGAPVVVTDRQGEKAAAVYALPYLEPSTSAGPLATDERTHAGVLRAAMGRVRADIGAQAALGSGAPMSTVVMAHAFVTGGATCESERDISVGGVSAVHPDVFDGVDYVALGHLHGPQQLSDRIHYSGSPLAMSFGEHTHTKGSWLVELEPGRLATEFVPAPVARGLRLLQGDLEDLLGSPAYAEAEDAYCQVTLTDPVRPLGAMDRLRARFPHTLVLRFEPRGAVTRLSSYTAALGRARSDLDVCCDFLQHVRAGRPSTDGERVLLEEALEASRIASAVRDDELGAMLPGLRHLAHGPGAESAEGVA